MKKNVFSFFIVLTTLTVVVACNGGAGVDELKRQIDSLENLNARNQSDLDNMSSFVSVLSEGLDTIAKQEGTLFYTNQGPEGTIVDREQLKKNLESFANTLAEQREKIRRMTDSLNAKGANMKKLETLITYLNKQIDEKDQMITRLQEELKQKNANIAQLSGKLSALSQNNSSLSQKVQEQEQQLSKQSAKINKGYVVMGSGKVLKESGIITGGGFMKKSSVNYNDLPRELFTQVDTRTFGGMQIPAAKPKVLSAMPSSSYEIVKTGKDASEIHITDPEAFWSNTKYLIIQTK